MTENWIDRQIREARERGEFDNLPGEGKPLKGLDGRHDPDWWIKQKLADEDLESTVESVQSLRAEARQLMSMLTYERFESDVREIVGDLNRRILDARRRRADGPVAATIATFDVDVVVAEWRMRRAADLA